MNPKGRPAGSRNKVNEAFLNDLLIVWKESGIEVVRKVARSDPSTFLRVAASILPREAKVEHSLIERIQQMSKEEIIERLQRLGTDTSTGEIPAGDVASRTH